MILVTPYDFEIKVTQIIIFRKISVLICTNDNKNRKE